MNVPRSIVAAIASLMAPWLAGPVAADGPAPGPLKVLLVCGGCCHDYTRQKEIIAKGLAERAHVEVTAVQQGGTATTSKIPLYDQPDYARGYDVVIHDDCFSDAKDPAWTAKILAPHKAGLPGVVLHCAMHSYRDGSDDWFKFCGVTSRRHGAGYPHEVLNVDPAHPVMAEFGPAWANPAGELYWIEKVWPTAHPLATSKNKEKGNDEVCVWTNEYGDNKAKVFGTTLGHHNETVGAPAYLDLLTRGVLWSAGKLGPEYLKPRTPKVVPANLGRGSRAVASTEQGGHPARQAVDGDPATRWSASGARAGEWLQLDIARPTRLNGLRLDWEASAATYRYRVESSRDGKAWTTLVDGSANTKPGPAELTFPPTEARLVKVTYLGSSTGAWGSLAEVELYGDKMIPAEPETTGRDGEAALLAGVRAPGGFDVNVFAAPPAVNYPVSVAAAPNGDLYVSSDKNGSLDRQPRRGSVLRLRDLDGDGRADEVKRFVPDVDSPRGLVWDHDRLYLMHPPHLSAYIDKDGDGIADEEKVLVRDIAFGFKDRPADHTSNGVTLGIDGWLYLAIGDFGFLKATGADGRTLQLRGGGVVRVRPDGTGLELFSRGTRNILEVGLDPLLNGFARDNTNDGGGWDIRLHHFTGLEDHGYPSLFKNFPDEAIAPLADYGGGSGCGTLYLSEPGFPAGFGDALYTADWGRDRVFRHTMTPKGATFTADQTEFLTLPRVTDLDVDAMGHIYASSWKGATFTYAGEDVGYVVRMTPRGYKPEPLPDYTRLDRTPLIRQLESPSHRRRLEAQRELIRRCDASSRISFLRDKLRRGEMNYADVKFSVEVDNATLLDLVRLAADTTKPLPARVAAVFALKEGFGPGSVPTLYGLLMGPDPSIREYALRALSDRAEERFTLSDKVRAAVTGDASPRTRLQAAESISRERPAHDGQAALAALLGDPDPIVAHTAARGLAVVKGADAAFAVVDDDRASPRARSGALRALQAMHESKVVDGLIRRLDAESRHDRRVGLIAALARLDHREGFWRGDSWGTRPDTSGPYYQPEAWEATPRIEAALKEALGRARGPELPPVLRELDRNKVEVPGELDTLLARAAEDRALVPIVVEHLALGKEIPPRAMGLLTKVAGAEETAPSVRAEATIALLKAEGDAPLRDALNALAILHARSGRTAESKRAREAFLGSPRLGRSRPLLEALAARRDGAASAWADAALLTLSAEKRGRAESRDAAAKAIRSGLADPARRAQILRAVALIGHQPSSSLVVAGLNDADPSVASAAREAARTLGIDPDADARLASGPKVEGLAPDQVLNAVATARGDRPAGERLFTRLACVNCHTVRADEPPRGPYLGNIATTYKRRELAEAILLPSKTIAQGFATTILALEDGRTLTGFVVKEAADVVTIRDGEGKEVQVPAAQVVERGKSDLSVMPEGLLKGISLAEFASLLDYLESLSKARPGQ